MIALFLKEIKGFFSSLTGYIVIVVFLLMNSLFMWIIPGENYNVFDKGYADLETMFFLAPWLFLFLVPAVTMRMFAEEKKSGTIELLFTRPLSDIKIVLAKYFAAVALVVLALLPTLIYFYSVSQLGMPKGNIDTGATWGSYLGLLFLASIYVAAGIFSSSITDNQIVAFIIGVFLCFFLYTGFETIGSISGLKPLEHFFVNLGINEHYRSISRGVLILKDVAYFMGAAAFFIVLTRFVLQSRK